MRDAAADPRERPDDALIDAIRSRYPVEAEIDLVLTRKMRRRGGPAYAAPALAEIAAAARRLIEADLGYSVQVGAPRWLSGGASKVQVAFELTWRGEDNGATVVTPMVVRMDPAASVTESSRRREFEVLRAVNGIVPAPKPYWVDHDGTVFPYPAMICGFVRGVAKPSVDADKVSGVGQNYGAELRATLASDFVGLLARLPPIDIDAVDGLKHFERPSAGSVDAVIRQIDHVRRFWEEDRIEDEPLMEVVYKWLRRNAPPLDRVSIVHGDYRSGNFLFDEAAGRITAILDWEGAVLGDRHRDLAWATMSSFQHLAEDGRTPLASGMLPIETLLAAYERSSGLPVDRERLHYYDIFNRYLLVALVMGASARAAVGARTHQDVLLNFVTAMGYPALGELAQIFEDMLR